MKAELIAVGTELLLGQITNSNAAILSRELASLGINVYYHTCVGDNGDRLKEVFAAALERSDLVIFTGGLGPTEDDLTKETVAEHLNMELVESELWRNKLKEFFEKLGREMPQRNLKQAMVPKGSQILINNNGTAPGILIEKDAKTIILLPGPPAEMEPIFSQDILPRLREKTRGIIKSRVIRLIGIGESMVEDKVRDLVRNSNPTLAPMFKGHEIHLRITAKAIDEDKAKEMIKGVEEEIISRLADYVYGFDDETLENKVKEILVARGLTLSAAESCSGGHLSNILTNVPGSSNFFLGSVVPYSLDLKEKLLHINGKLLDEAGPVSEETARAMAENIKEMTGSDYALAITGLAGPATNEDEPVGLVYIALVGDKTSICKEFNFWGSRERIKGRAAVTALNLLRKTLEDTDK